MSRFDPTTWIDRQRAAGAARGNIFADILSAAQTKRRELRHGAGGGLECRLDSILAAKTDAASHETPGGQKSGVSGIPSFQQLVDAVKLGC